MFRRVDSWENKPQLLRRGRRMEQRGAISPSEARDSYNEQRVDSRRLIEAPARVEGGAPWRECWLNWPIDREDVRLPRDNHLEDSQRESRADK